MILAVNLYFGNEIIHTNQSQRYSYQVNHTLFGYALLIELLYWFVTRLILARIYFLTYGKGQKCLFNSLTMLSKSLVTLLPTDMLLFFGYEGPHRYEQRLLNLAWVRRIVSSSRIVVQILAVDGLLRGGEFITTVFCSQIFYLTLLLTSICPQQSKYDAFSWYRRL